VNHPSGDDVPDEIVLKEVERVEGVERTAQGAAPRGEKEEPPDGWTIHGSSLGKAVSIQRSAISKEMKKNEPSGLGVLNLTLKSSSSKPQAEV
jgi:hypothetical protein